ncbi:MAG: dioxygenase [Bacteroidia bacterium]|nr:dioxygenase [Bacteroidia bacterium]
MNRSSFIHSLAALSAMTSLSSFKNFTDTLPKQSNRLPVLFTSHGNPMDIPMTKEQRPFWNTLFELGQRLQENYDVKAALVVSAHWCTKGSFVNSSLEQKQIYDYYGFPKEYYEVYYKAQGSPEIAREVNKLVPGVSLTGDWGLDHGAWPMLMHLFPKGNIPVFQLSIDYYAKPQYHFDLGNQLKALRDKGVLIIGSGSLIHNLRLAMQKMQSNDFKPYGWEQDYDDWIKKQIDTRNVKDIINYETSHKLGLLASPTPDHFVPVLYSLGLMHPSENIQHFYDIPASIPAFSERSFIIGA